MPWNSGNSGNSSSSGIQEPLIILKKAHSKIYEIDPLACTNVKGGLSKSLLTSYDGLV
jgi:hypothetical protein